MDKTAAPFPAGTMVQLTVQVRSSLDVLQVPLWCSISNGSLVVNNAYQLVLLLVRYLPFVCANTI